MREGLPIKSVSYVGAATPLFLLGLYDINLIYWAVYIIAAAGLLVWIIRPKISKSPDKEIFRQEQSLSGITLFLSIAVCTVFTLAAILAYERFSFDSPIFRIICAAELLLVLFMALGSPYAIDVDPKEIVIRYHTGKIQIPLNEITKVEHYFHSINPFRLRGVYGFFATWGRYSDKRIGQAEIYAASLSNLILIETAGGKKYIFSSNDPRELLDVIRSLRDSLPQKAANCTKDMD